MTDPDREIWNGMLAHLREHHPALCRHWFADLTPVTVAEGSVYLRAEKEVHREYLRRACVDAFVDAAQSASNSLLGVRFLGPGEPAPEPARAPGRGAHEQAPSARDEGVAGPRGAETEIKPPLLRQGPLHKKRDGFPLGSSEAAAGGVGSFFLNPDYIFENFIVGEGNRWAYAAAVAVAENPGQSYNPLFIHGDVGLGKTHLLQAICLRIKEESPDAVLHYVSCDEFINEFMQSVQNNQMGEFRHRFRGVDVLVIDDIHFLTSRERSQEEFFHTFNSLHQTQKQIIISSDAPPQQIPNLESRLVSRFQSGLVAEIFKPTFETRVAILFTKARLRGIELGAGVAEYVASRFETNIRELEGAITQLQVFASMERSAITLDLAKQVFAGAESRSARPQPTVDDIIQLVSGFYDVKRAELLGKRRHQSISLPRQVCMYLVRQHTRLSLEEIGAQFGGRDHSTVIHAVRTIESKQDQDRSLAETLAGLEADLLKRTATK
jgi:chromosomal replication initiator protein